MRTKNLFLVLLPLMVMVVLFCGVSATEVIRFDFDGDNWKNVVLEPKEAQITTIDGVPVCQLGWKGSWGWVGVTFRNPVDIIDENMVMRIKWRIDCSDRNTMSDVILRVYYGRDLKEYSNVRIGNPGDYTFNEWQVSEVRLTDYERFPLWGKVYRVDLYERGSGNSTYTPSIASIEFLIKE